MGSAADIVHLDLLLGGALPIPAVLLAKLTVTVVATAPRAANELEELGIRGASAHCSPQIESLSREQAGVELSFGGEACPGAIAAERLGHRRDETDFPRAVVEAPALGDLAEVIFRDGMHRPT